MSKNNTNLDEINNICSLIGEILALSQDLRNQIQENISLTALELIESKAMTVKKKAQRMENRLREYRTTIESLGFKRIKEKRSK